MKKIRASLSRLFFGQQSRQELERIFTLEKLTKLHQGKPFAFDEGKLRFMYFSKKSVQSAMRIDQPNKLLCGYTRAMMAFLLLNPAPKHILMIGLGGGSLVKFCYTHLPETKIRVLEIDPNVIALRQQFMIPDDDERLEIVHCDAVNYLAGENNKERYDVILLDGFDQDGIVHPLNNTVFYADCLKALSADGIFVLNMWGKRKMMAGLLLQLRDLFNENIWWCRSLDSYNLLSFALKNPRQGFKHPLTHQALTLPKLADWQVPLELPVLLESMDSFRLKLWHKNSRSESLNQIPAVTQDLEELTLNLKELMSLNDKMPKNDFEWSALYQD